MKTALLSLVIFVAPTLIFAGTQSYAINDTTGNAINFTLPKIPSEEIHRFQSLRYAAMLPPVNGTITVMTNIGLFETDAQGTIIRTVTEPDGLQPFPSAVISMAHNSDSTYAYISTGRPLQFGCPDLFLPYDVNGGLYRFNGDELTKIGEHSGNATIYGDPTGTFWTLSFFETIGYEGSFRINLIRGDSLVSFPDIMFGQSFWFDEDSQSMIIGYSTSVSDMLTGFYGSQFARWDGESFVPIEVPDSIANRPPNTRWMQFSEDLRQNLSHQLPWLTARERDQWGQYIVTAIHEAQDGSVWSLESAVYIACVAKESAQTNPSDIASLDGQAVLQQFLHLHSETFDGKLVRHFSGGTEHHATWMSESEQYYGIRDMDVFHDGSPLLSGYLNIGSTASTDPKATVWHYAYVDQPLIDVPGGISRRYARPFSLARANAGRWFLYSSRSFYNQNELYLLDQRTLHPIDLPPDLNLNTAFGIHPAGTDRWRMYTMDGMQIDFVLPDGEASIPEAALISADEAVNGFGGWSDDSTFWYAEYKGQLTGKLDDQEILSIPWPFESPITGLIQARESELWVATCGSGVIRVDINDGSLGRLGFKEGLPSDCVLNISSGSSGRIFMGTADGYSVVGEAMSPGGAPRPQLEPLSTEDEDTRTLPASTRLLPNYPNPFNPSTTIPFEIQDAGRVSITVHNVIGQWVMTIAEGVWPAGIHEVQLNSGALSSGVYVVRLTHETGGVYTRAVTLVK